MRALKWILGIPIVVFCFLPALVVALMLDGVRLISGRRR
jgi:hypothetical protein